MSNYLVETSIKDIPKAFGVNLADTEKKLLYSYLNKVVGKKTIDASEIQSFIYRCITTKANPLKKEIYAIPYYIKKLNKYTINTIFSYHFKLKKFNELCSVDSIKDRAVILKKKANGKILEAKGICEIKKKGSIDVFYTEVYLSEYTKDKEKNEEYSNGYENNYSDNSGLWKTKPLTMIKKVAVSQCIDRAAPVDLEHMVTDVEYSPIPVVTEESKKEIANGYTDFYDEENQEEKAKSVVEKKSDQEIDIKSDENQELVSYFYSTYKKHPEFEEEINIIFNTLFPTINGKRQEKITKITADKAAPLIREFKKKVETKEAEQGKSIEDIDEENPFGSEGEMMNDEDFNRQFIEK